MLSPTTKDARIVTSSHFTTIATTVRNHELLFRLRTKEGNKVEAFVQPKGAPARELLLLVGTGKNFTLVSFVGNIDLEWLGELRQALE